MSILIAASLLVFSQQSEPAPPVHRHRVVVEVAMPGESAQLGALESVENLRRSFGAEGVEIEVVCMGGGVNMLLDKPGPLGERVKRGSKNGVEFAACANTLRGFKIQKSRLFRFARVVDAGIGELVRKQEAGWSYVKAGA